MPTGRCGSGRRAPCARCRGVPAVRRSSAGLAEPDGSGFFADPRHVLAAVGGAVRAARPDAGRGAGIRVLPDRPRRRASMASRWCRTPTASAAARPRPRCSRRSGWRTRSRSSSWSTATARPRSCRSRAPCASSRPGSSRSISATVETWSLAADQGVMLKRCIKAAARATGQRATFMAKPFAEQSGSGLHVHLSLRRPRTAATCSARRRHGERQLRHAIRGLQDLMPEVDAGVRAQRQQLPPPAPDHLRADGADLGLEQPHGGTAHPAGRHRPPAGSSTGSPARMPIPISCWRRCWPGCCGASSSRRSRRRADRGQRLCPGCASLPVTWEAAIEAFRDGQLLPRMVRRSASADCSPPVASRSATASTAADHADRVRMVPDDGIDCAHH